MAQTLVDRHGTEQGWRFIEELRFITSPPINFAYGTPLPTLIPLNFQDFAAFLVGPPDALAAYLVFRRLMLLLIKPRAVTEPQLVGITVNNVNWAIPIGGGSVTYWFQHSALHYMQMASSPTGTGITQVAVAYHNPSITPEGGIILTTPLSAGVADNWDLTAMYDERFGLVDYRPLDTFNPFSTGAGHFGIDITITFTNTSGAVKNQNSNLWGADLLYDYVQFTVDYQDWTGGIHALAVYNDIEQLTPFQLDLLLPVPLLDPGMTNFGTLRLTPLSAYACFTPFYYLSAVVTASIAYLVDR